VREGQSVLVLGCGMSGLLQVKLALARGARVAAADINPGRLALAGEFGAEVTVDATEDVAGRLVAETGRLADVVLLCTSAMLAFEAAWRAVDKGGTVVVFAVPGPEKEIVVPLNDFWRKEITVLTSYYCGPPDWEEALGLIASGIITVSEMITHRLPLSQVAEGYRLVQEGKDSLKVIIRPND